MDASSGSLVGQTGVVSAPRIAMTTWRRTMPTFVSATTDLYTVGSEYPLAVQRAGGLPVLLPHHDPVDVQHLLSVFDAVVMVGGDDVDPRCYDEVDQGVSKGTSASADASDIAVARAAIELGLPLFAICRGYQVLNVAMGGSLHQDMTSPDGLHRPISNDPHEVMGERHRITIDPTSKLAAAYQSTTRTVNSIHHQAIDRLADGWHAVAWADDGTIEAIEADIDRPVLAVQWHPEKIAAEGDQVLFEHFINEMVR
jgi:putative glutamine amidotransferase